MKKSTELWIENKMKESGWSFEAALTHYIYHKCTHGELVKMYIQLHRDYCLEVEE